MKVAFFEMESGRFSGKTYEGPDEWIGLNTPAGCGAWPYESRPPEAAAWIVQEGVLVNMPAAVDDWISRRDARAREVYAQIRAAEDAQSRPMREIMDALMVGGEPPAQSVERFSAIKASIDTDRARYLAILAAQTPEALDAI